MGQQDHAAVGVDDTAAPDQRTAEVDASPHGALMVPRCAAQTPIELLPRPIATAVCGAERHIPAARWSDERTFAGTVTPITSIDTSVYRIPSSPLNSSVKAVGSGATSSRSLPMPGNRPAVTGCGAGRMTETSVDRLSAVVALPVLDGYGGRHG
nr:hypothetical protein [Micromonospora provocatoris]